MVPSSRLLWIGAGVAVPLLLIGALYAPLRTTSLAAVVGLAAIALVDFGWRERTLAGLRVELPAIVRMVQGVSAPVSVGIHQDSSRRDSARGRTIRLGLSTPASVAANPEERWITLPAATGLSRLDWELRPQRRGTYSIEECYLGAASPLGLWDVRRRQAVAAEIRVYPNLRDSSTLQALRRGTENLHASRQLGRGREFEKLRDYSPGDSSEEIHWKASARRGRPITKVFQVERTQEIYLVIDSSRLSSRAIRGESALEWAIKGALTVGAVSERRGDMVGLVTFSDGVGAFLRARRGKPHYAAFRDAINCLEPRPVSPDFEELAVFLRLRLRRRCLILFLTALDDPVLAQHFELAARLLSQRHLVMAATLRPDSAVPLFENDQVSSTEDIYRALAGQVGFRKLRELHGALTRQGVRLELLQPQGYTAALVRLYDEVKQRQLI
jgi:uncharacterized protein (DUF58 family)